MSSCTSNTLMSLKDTSAFLVLIYLGIKLGKYLWFIFKLYCRCQKNLFNRYSVKDSESWAFICGATSEIGKEFCLQLAQKGFNIVLLGRNNDKLKNVEEQVLNNGKKQVKTKIICCDLRKNNNFDVKYFQDIINMVDDLDISVFVNNAGIQCFSHFFDQDPNFYLDLININCVSPFMFTYFILNKMNKRSQRSCIINISSAIACGYPTAYYAAHSASKAFINMFTRSLQDEFKNLDFLSCAPFDDNKSTPKSIVKGTFDMLGYDDFTNGSSKHIIKFNFLLKIPIDFYRTCFAKCFSKTKFKNKQKVEPQTLDVVVVENDEKNE